MTMIMMTENLAKKINEEHDNEKHVFIRQT